VSLDHPPVRVPWYFLLGYLTLPIHVALHELGHTVAGALVGFRFTSVRVGWLVVERVEGRLRVGWSAPAVPVFLGFHQAVPTDLESFSSRQAIVAAVGPVTTAAVAFACWTAAARLEPPTTVGAVLACWTLSAGCWLGVFLAVLNLVPIRFQGGYRSDGAWIREAFWPSPAVRLLDKVIAACEACRRPREWGGSVDELLSVMDQAKQPVSGLLLALLVALDTGVDARVDEIMPRLLQGEPSLQAAHRAIVRAEAGLIAAFRGDLQTARAHFTALEACPQRHLLEACIAVGEGDLAKARSARGSWEEGVARVGPGARVGWEWAEEKLRARLDVAGDPSPPAPS
jgi:hypothetical protein